MGKQLYAKPIHELIREMVKDWDLKPGQVFTKSKATEWFQQNYSLVQPNTLAAHLRLMSINDPNRLHFSALSKIHDLLFRVSTSQYRLYDPATDPAPIHELVAGDVEKEEAAAAAEEDDDDDSGEPKPGSAEFALEKDLQGYLAKNLHILEPGLTLYEDEGITGTEVFAGHQRRIDVLAVDKAGNFVVIELKLRRSHEKVIGQLIRYLGWVKINMAKPKQSVRGIIVGRTMTDDLRIACAAMPDVRLFEYTLKVDVTPVPAYAPG